jgi:rhodanese-related sulfurtransferase
MSIGKQWLLALIIVGSTAIAAQAQAAPPPTESISAEELKAKVESNQPVTIIDVRSPEGYANSTTTVKGAIHFKVRHIKYRLQFPPLKDVPKDQEIVTYCACPKDEASVAAAQILSSSGFRRVKVLRGGWSEWLRVNGPVEPKPRG